MNTKTEEILKELNKIIVGKEAVLEKTLMAILSRGHILLDDVPGVGKTTLALACSKVLGLIIIESSLHRMLCRPTSLDFQCIIKKVEHLNISQVWL